MNGNLLYGPLNNAAIPTLSNIMLILLSLMLMFVALHMAKRKGSKASKFFIALLGTSALFATVDSQKIISIAGAAFIQPAATQVDLSNPNGGSVAIAETEYNVYTNTSGIIQKIKGIDINGISCDGFPHGTNGANQECSLNLILQPGDKCEIDCSMVGYGISDGNIL